VKNVKFRTKLIVIIIAALVIQGILIGAFSHYYAKKIVMDNNRDNMVGMINLVDTNINAKVRFMTELIENAATSQTIKSLILSGQKETDPFSQSEFVLEFFDNLDKSIGSVNSVMIIKPSKEIYYRNSEKKSLSLIVPDANLSEAYQGAAAFPGQVIWMGISDNLVSGTNTEEKQKVISASYAITDEESGEVLGVLVVELHPNTFSTLLLSGQNIFQNQYTFIIDENDSVIANNRSIDQEWIGMITDKFNQGLRKFEITSNNRNYYVCGQYNGMTGWETYSVIATDQIFPQAGTLRYFIMLFVAISTLIASIIIMGVSYTMTRPINDLSKAMRKVNEEDFSVQIKNRRNDEMGKLIDSFNFMTNKINSLIREVYQEKIAQKNAELEALEAQINPHFLYNTLDSINWMLIAKEEYEISDVIISLGNLMKYCVDKNNAMVTLEQETDYVVSYLFIQKIRMEDRLEYEINVPESLKQFRVPKLILQPLVENAIKHGIEPHKEGGIVRIRVLEQEDAISIEVEDNGKGIDEMRLRQLEGHLSGEDQEFTSIGINNVDKRIRLHYGEEYKIRIVSDFGKGTRVIITIPKNPKGGNP